MKIPKKGMRERILPPKLSMESWKNHVMKLYGGKDTKQNKAKHVQTSEPMP